MAPFQKQKNIFYFRQILGSLNIQKPEYVIQIVGTKGKTSTASLLQDFFLQQGISVGRFTSPHVYSPCERIQFLGNLISEAEWAKEENKIRALEQEASIELHFFSRILLMALSFFAEKKAQVILLEAGIGGLYDVTTYTQPDLLVITRIGKDHVEILGKTFFQQAWQKCRALRFRGQPTILLPQESRIKTFWLQFLLHLLGGKKVSPVLPRRKTKEGNRLFFEYPECHYEMRAPQFCEDIFLFLYHFAQKFQTYRSVSLQYQEAGRFEQISSSSAPIILDGAHNPLAMRTLMRELQNQFPQIEKWHCILFVQGHKDILSILQILEEKVDSFYLLETIPSQSVQMPLDTVISWLKRRNLSYQIFHPSRTRETCMTKPLLVTGSFYHLKYIKNWLDLD